MLVALGEGRPDQLAAALFGGARERLLHEPVNPCAQSAEVAAEARIAVPRVDGVDDQGFAAEPVT